MATFLTSADSQTLLDILEGLPPTNDLLTIMQRLKRSPDDDSEHAAAVLAMAKRERHRDGDIEIEDDTIVSEGDDNGAYVLAWVWVNFAGTDLDKDHDFPEVSNA